MLSKLNKFLSSVKLAVFLLIAIGVLAMIGTFINQGDTVAQYKSIFGPTWYGILNGAGFLNIYDSWYFIGLALLLMINLIVASVNSAPLALKDIFGPYPSFQEIFDKKNPKSAYESIKTKKTPGEIIPALNSVLGRSLGETSVEKGVKEFYYSKNSVFRISPYIAHISVLIIMAGVLLNAKYGFRSFNNINVGQKIDVSYILKNNKPIKLPFYIKLDKYRTRYYPDGIPKSYESTITIINKEHVSVISKKIKVNHPLTYKGITIYQASYGHYKPTVARFLVLDVNNKKYKAFIDLAPKNLYKNINLPNLKGSDLRLVPVNNPKRGHMPFYLKLYKTGKTGAHISKKLDFNIVAIKQKNGKVGKPFIFAKYKNIVFLYSGIKTYYYSGVEISKNSYVGVVWVGSIMLVISLFFSFFFNYSRTWVRLKPGEGGKESSVEIISVPKKNYGSFYKDFNAKIAKIKEKIKEKIK